MGKIILVTGGARSGKSSFAEELAKKLGDRILYIATSIPFDEEMKLRVKKHREQRPSYWETLEAWKAFDRVIPDWFNARDRLKPGLTAYDGILLDCITVMVTNIMMEKLKDWEHISSEEILDFEASVSDEIDKLLAAAAAAPFPFIIVTNEVGMGIVPEYPSARIFRDAAGRANQKLAGAAGEVYLCVSGIPVRIK